MKYDDYRVNLIFRVVSRILVIVVILIDLIIISAVVKILIS